jgi:hypothetical protein
MQVNIIAAVWTLATKSVSRTALDCCTAMNPLKAIVLPNPRAV